MLRVILKYLSDRFPLYISLPLSLILALALLPINEFKILNAVVITGNLFLILFILRLIDDLSDLKYDRITHPERFLVKNNYAPYKINYTIIILILFVFVINWMKIYALGILALCIVYYFIFYKFKHKIKISFQPFFVNLIFLIIPYYINFYFMLKLDLAIIVLSGFIYLSSVAHDYAHSIENESEVISGVPSLSKSWPGAGPAILAYILFFSAFLTWVFLYIYNEVPLAFLFGLMLLFLYISIINIRLILNPCKKNAKRFYIWGFLYFLLPLLAIILCRIWNAIFFSYYAFL